MRQREGPPPQFRAAMEKERDANHADLRDALALLTPDQQASAWEIVSRPRLLMQRMGPGRDGPVMRFRARSMQRGGEAMMIPDGGDEEAVDALSVEDDDH